MKRILVAALLACIAQVSSAQVPPSIGAFQHTIQELPVGFVKCAGENQRCEFKGRAWVVFGSPFTLWSIPKTYVDGVACTVEVFAGPPGSSCYMMPVSAKWPQMLPLPSGLALLDELLAPPSTNPALCQLVGHGGTGPMGLQGLLPSGYAQARWCRTASGWAGYFVVQDRHYTGPPLELKWPEAVPVPAVTGSAVLTWAAPTTRGDGTPLTDLAGYTIKYGPERGKPVRMMPIDDPKATMAEINWLTPGVWWFVVTALDSEGNESAPGYEISRTIIVTPPLPPPPPPPPVVATWVVSAAPTYPVTFTRSPTGVIVWVRSKTAGGGRATVGSSCDCSLTVLEGANRYCKYSPMANDVALCVPKLSLPGGGAAIR